MWPNSTQPMGKIPHYMCSYIIALRNTDWFGTDWDRRPSVRWLATNGTQWLCGSNLWPWLPPGWIGRCTLGFVWMQGRTTFTISPPANLRNLQQRWTRSVFHWYDHLASVFLPQLRIKSVIWHMEALNKFTMKALNDTQHSLSLLDLEVSQMHKAALQNQAIVKTCAIIKTECCVYIPDYHQNISGFLSDMNHQIKSMSDPTLSLNDWLNSWSGPGFWTTIKTLFIGLIILLVFLIIICLFHCWSSACQQSFTSWTTSHQIIVSSPEELYTFSALDSTGTAFQSAEPPTCTYGPI
uniref:Envelope glycoprotein n=2 Tax=Equus caballus TaxID=9796 RepID=A0A9L0R690_HORSE